MLLQRSQPFLCLQACRCGSLVNLYISGNERAHQPGPDSALVICAVAGRSITFVPASILRICRCQTPQTVRRQQVFLNSGHNLSRSLEVEHRVGQAHSQYLIGADARVRRTSVYNVVQITAVLVPQEAIEAPLRECCHVAVALSCSVVPDRLCEAFHDAECVIPERLDFDGLAASWRYDPVTDLGIHPCKLHARFSAREQPGGIDLYSEAGTSNMPVDDVGQNWIEIVPNEVKILRVG